MKRLSRRSFYLLAGALALVALYLIVAYRGPSTPRDIREAVPVEHFRLANGLEVVVVENHRIPAVTHMLLVKAGAADDPYGKTGLAHYLEHLMFTGSKNYAEGIYDHTIARLGGEHNAYTTKDFTVYYATIAREHLGTVMAMEADRFANPTFAPDKVARELKVITEERNARVENNAAAQWAEQLTALTFLNHPYHHPTIGWAEDMATLTLTDAETFFRTYYRPSNMVLIVAGDISPAAVKREAQRYYSGWGGGAAPARMWADEPPLRLTRHATMRDPKVQEPRLLRQYTAPSVRHGDTTQSMPLAVFAQYLGGGASSLLYERLVQDEKLASSIEADYDAFLIGPAVFSIGATPAPGVTLEQLEQGLDRALASVALQKPDEAAFARAKTRLKAEVIFAQDGLSSLGNVMAMLYGIGLDEQYFYRWPETVEAVTTTQMQEAANRVLAPARRVTGYLLPGVATPAASELQPPAEAAHAP